MLFPFNQSWQSKANKLGLKNQKYAVKTKNYRKFDFKNSRKILIEKSALKNNIFFSNNCMESINPLINFL